MGTGTDILDKIRKDRENTKITLKEIEVVYHKWLAFSDFLRFEIVFAVWLSKTLTGTPLWLIIVAPSGDAKTEQLRALHDKDNFHTRLLNRITSKTLVSGKKNEVDLAPELDNKVVLIMDFAEMLNLHPNEKIQIWSQLRNLYDGFAGTDSGGGARKSYSNLQITLIAASTPAIDEQVLIHNQLGTRELLLRPSSASTRKRAEAAWSNEPFEEEMRRELNDTTLNFLRNRLSDGIFNQDIKDNSIRDKLINLAEFLRSMRATASFDQAGELRGFVFPEEPTRSLKQLKRLFVCLKALDDDYSDERALEGVRVVVHSSVDPLRLGLLRQIVHFPDGTSSYRLAQNLRVGNKSVHTELFLLWNLHLIKCEVEEIVNYGRTVEKRKWSPYFDHPITRMIAIEERVEVPSEQFKINEVMEASTKQQVENDVSTR